MVAFGPTVPFKQRGPTGVLKEILELDDSAGHPYTPARNYTTLGMALRLIPASLRCWCMWRAFRAQPDLDRALSHHGVPLGALALPSFRDTMLLQLPWAIRSFHEVEAALAWERPDVLVLYAEYSGLGRAAIAAAARVGVVSFAVQHGILYPRLYGAEHSAEEVGPAADGRDCVPIPTRTAVFGSMAKDILMQRGHYRAEQLVVTGSPKFDALVSAGKRFDRRATQRLSFIIIDPAGMVPLVALRRTKKPGSARAGTCRDHAINGPRNWTTQSRGTPAIDAQRLNWLRRRRAIRSGGGAHPLAATRRLLRSVMVGA